MILSLKGPVDKQLSSTAGFAKVEKFLVDMRQPQRTSAIPLSLGYNRCDNWGKYVESRCRFMVRFFTFLNVCPTYAS